MSQIKVNAARRNFMTFAACTPALAIVSLLTRKTPASLPEVAAMPDGIASTGYHETDHIRKYYYAAAYF